MRGLTYPQFSHYYDERYRFSMPPVGDRGYQTKGLTRSGDK